MDLFKIKMKTPDKLSNIKWHITRLAVILASRHRHQAAITATPSLVLEEVEIHSRAGQDNKVLEHNQVAIKPGTNLNRHSSQADFKVAVDGEHRHSKGTTVEIPAGFSKVKGPRIKVVVIVTSHRVINPVTILVRHLLDKALLDLLDCMRVSTPFETPKDQQKSSQSTEINNDRKHH